MLSNDFSQLPVMTGPRELKGIVSWKSIGSRLALDKEIRRKRLHGGTKSAVGNGAPFFRYFNRRS